MNPDLIPIPGNVDMTDAQKSTALAQQQPIRALTAPISNTAGQEERVFVCAVPFASMHRTDGKKLPFVKGYLKTKIQEDIRFLEAEISAGNPYIKAGDENDIVAAELVYNPMAAVEHRVRKNLESEIRADLEVRIRSEMDAAKLAGVDGRNMDRLGVNTVQVNRINPVSSSDLANVGGTAASNTGVAAAAAARLASLAK